MSRRIALALIAVCALSVAAQVRENVTVEVVEVPVYITSGNNQPVEGLTRDAFELFVDGRPQPIEYFDAIDFAKVPTPAAQTAVERPRRERRLYLLLFDLSFATPARIKKAQTAAEQAVARSNPATDFFGVATYSSNRGVQFVSSFLSDRVAITRAIYTLRASSAQDPLGVALSSPERAQWLTATELGGSAEGISPLLGDQVNEILTGGQANQDMQKMQGNRLIEYQVDALGDVAARLSALEGQKHILIFTEGFDSTRITDIKANGRPPNLDAHLLDVVKQMHETFVSAGVTLDSIDIQGLRHTLSDLDNDALYMLSRGTGGRVIVNRNDLGDAVDTIMRAERTVYVLGFSSAGRKHGKITVRVNGLPHGSEVSYREGFGYVPPGKNVDALQLADILLNDVPQSGATLDAGVTSADGTSVLAVAFNRAEVVPQLPNASPGIELLIYILDEHGSTVGFKSKRVSLTGPARVPTGYLTLREPFELPPGKYTAKVLFRIMGTRVLGYVRRDFVVE
ncbi:MAG TPA: VWA domain-containing protein [Thermoanaerobaculia bacterium]|nr:VWA domain-containing protein [Thermoanaerobaculia bacterium]